MPIAAPSWHEVTPSEFPHEREAIDWLRSALPANRGLVAWSNFSFDADGTSNEVDVAVVGPGGMVLVEIKSHPGQLTIDRGNWVVVDNSVRREIGRNPRLLIEKKCKRLKGRLQRMAAGSRLPFIQPLVFYSHPEVQISGIDSEDLLGACVRDTGSSGGGYGVVEAIIDPGCAGFSNYADTLRSGDIQYVAQLFDRLNIRRRSSERRVGQWILDEQTDDGPAFEDWFAHSAEHDEDRRTIRVFPFPVDATQADREFRRHLARREWDALVRLRHPCIERAFERLDDGERGPAIVLDDHRELCPLDRWLKDFREEVNTDGRVTILRQLAEALDHAHQQRVLHRSLAPSSILMSADAQDPKPTIDRWSTSREILTHASGDTIGALEAVADVDRPYQAPELGLSSRCATPGADVFSLGAIAYFLWTGEAPPTDEEHRICLDQNGIRSNDALKRLDAPIRRLIEQATRPNVEQRLRSAVAFLELLDPIMQAEENAARITAAAVVADVTATPPAREPGSDTSSAAGSAIRLAHRLGSGSTATAYLCSFEGEDAILKVAHTAEDDPIIENEALLLEQLDHPSIVKLVHRCQWEGRRALVVESSGAQTLGELLRRGASLGTEETQFIATQLFDALLHLEAREIVHGDLKPDHIGVSGSITEPTIRVFDFSAGGTRSAWLGTEGYSDPIAPRDDRGAGVDRYSVAVVLHELLTGDVPAWGDGLSDPRSLSIPHPTLSIDPSDSRHAFFSRALNADLGQRFSSAREMTDAWDDALQGRIGSPDTPAGQQRQAGGSSSTATGAPPVPSCPACAAPMVRRKRRSDGHPFWGCRAYPDCRGTRDIEEELASSPGGVVTSTTPLARVDSSAHIRLNSPRADLRLKAFEAAAIRRATIAKLSDGDRASAATSGRILIADPRPKRRFRNETIGTVLSIVEKILRRGRVTPLSPQLESELDELVSSVDGVSRALRQPAVGPASIFCVFESDEERRFAEDILPARLGADALAFMATQVTFSAITGVLDGLHRRVDFTWCAPGGAALVVEIDGPQHAETVREDEERDRLLKAAGWEVIRIPTAEVHVGHGPHIEMFFSRVAERPDDERAFYDIVASRALQVQHCLLLAVLGNPVPGDVRVCLEWPRATECLDITRFMDLVSTDFNALLNDVATLYGEASRVPRFVPVASRNLGADVCIAIGASAISSSADLDSTLWIHDLPGLARLFVLRFP